MPNMNTMPVTVCAVLGSTSLPIGQVLKLGRGAIIALETGVDDPIALLVNNVAVARGELQVKGDRMSIQVTELLRGGAQ